ncbi:hypothetical protein [Beijerinckia sp. L45]|uniref:hypothetical protein n=1 Tax=Beijerinckia sp. L45 TaxID=1641855 RepID=UPI00131B4045|nr:hypothetical protein [Beijerinckia sp. L45]
MKLTFNFREFERAAKRIGGAMDQIPFALAQSLNDAAEATRKTLIEDTWPSSIKQRNKSFMKAALTLKGNRATKKRLRVAITDKLNRASLALHADGGTKVPRRANLAVPSKQIAARRSGRGVPQSLKPLNLADSFKKGDVIYQRVGKKGRKLKLAYVLKKAVKIKKDVPFRQDFARSMRREVSRAFGPRFRAAMKTRR